MHYFESSLLCCGQLVSVGFSPLEIFPADHNPLLLGHVFYSQVLHVPEIINFLPYVTQVKNVIVPMHFPTL